MSIYHLTVKMHSRAKNKKLHALRALAYRTGSRIVDPVTQHIYDSTSKSREVIHNATITPGFGPAWKDNPQDLWQHVHQSEKRKDAAIFREFECALPKEIADGASPEAWVRLIENFIRDQLTPHGALVTYAIHNKPGNPHVHMMCTTRHWTADGFGSKNRALDTFKVLYGWRKSWADHCNTALQRAGRSERVTHKSFAELGLQREATAHVGPAHVEQTSPQYAQKREEVIARNKKVHERNHRRRLERQRRAHVHLRAGACGVQMVRHIGSWEGFAPADQGAQPARTYPLALRSEGLDHPALADQSEADARRQLLLAWPDAETAFNVLAQWRETLGRSWSWSIFLGQYQRIRKSQENPLAELLAKELMWVVSRAPKRLPDCLDAADPPHVIRAAFSVKEWVGKNKPQLLGALEALIEQAQSRLPEFRQRATPSATEVRAPANKVPSATFREVLVSFPELSHLGGSATDIVAACQRLAAAIDRPFTPEILRKRLQRMTQGKELPEPITNESLIESLLIKDLVFAAKRRPHRLADALRAVPPLRIAFFEELVRDALIGTVREPNHAQAARALSAFQQLELQAKWAVEQVLTPQQLGDFEYRRSCCQRFGSTYTWQTFQADINRLAGSPQGWQRAWWDELADQFTPTVLESISALCPAWYERSFEQWSGVQKTTSQVTQQPGDRGHAQDFRGVTGVSRTDDGLQTRMNTGFRVPT